MSEDAPGGRRPTEINDTQRVIDTIDAFISTFGGSTRLRDLKARLLILQATAANRGIHVSELARRCDAPAESVRRLVAAQVKLGHLHYLSDPQDERRMRIRATDAGVILWNIEAISQALRHFAVEPTTALPALIVIADTFLDQFPAGMRIHGIKIALLIQRATLQRRGISTSELARLTGATLETVRRHMTKHVDLGTVRFEPDPEDERVNLVMSCSLEHQNRSVNLIVKRLAAIDWGAEPHTEPTA